MLKLRARITSVVARELFVGHIRLWIINELITLLFITRGYTALWKQISLHYGEVYSLVKPAS